MKIVEARDQLVLPRPRAQHAHPRFHRRRPGVVELESAQIPRQHLRQLLAQPGLDLGGEVVGVHQLPGVLRDRLGDLRMAVPQRRDVDAGGEVDVFVPVGVDEHAAVAGVEDDGEELDLAGEAFEVFRAPRMQRLRLRPRRWHAHIRNSIKINVRPVHCFRGCAHEKAFYPQITQISQIKKQTKE